MMTLDQALTVARELDEETAWARDGAPHELSPAVVAWLARLALHHPQVSAAVAAALPSSGVRWAGAWGTSHAVSHDLMYGARVGADGEVVGRIEGRTYAGAHAPYTWLWWAGDESGRAPTEGAARAEVDERLIAGYTLLGEVYRRAPVQCGDCRGKGRFSPWGKPSSDPSHRTCLSCDGAGAVPRG